MDEEKLIEELIRELEFASDSWQQGSYKQHLFALFRQFPKTELGVPELSGDVLKDRIRDTLGSNLDEYKEIEDAVYEFCSAWDEWKYAVEHWARD